MGFFRRFGSHFNLYTDAVAVGSGGICPKKNVCQFEEDVLIAKLCVQDISTLRCLPTTMHQRACICFALSDCVHESCAPLSL